MPYPQYGYPTMGNYAPLQTYLNQPTLYPPATPNVAPAASVGQTQGFVCKPVTSRAEAVAYQIPFDGTTTYFVDTSNGCIYAKTFNFNDGTAPLQVYVREVDNPAPVVQYATVDMVEDLKREISELKKTRKVVKKNEPDDDGE